MGANLFITTGLFNGSQVCYGAFRDRGSAAAHLRAYGIVDGRVFPYRLNDSGIDQERFDALKSVYVLLSSTNEEPEITAVTLGDEESRWIAKRLGLPTQSLQWSVPVDPFVQFTRRGVILFEVILPSLKAFVVTDPAHLRRGFDVESVVRYGNAGGPGAATHAFAFATSTEKAVKKVRPVTAFSN